MAEPRKLAEAAEGWSPPAGRDENFAGWGIMGAPFASGHVLALRRFPASSVGPGYTSLWHRTPAGNWTFYSDVQPMASCNRFFGSAVDSVDGVEINIQWTGPRSLIVDVPSADFRWEARLGSTPATRGMNLLGKLLPKPLWRQPLVLDLMAGMAGRLLGAGRLRMHGRVPNGQWFIANPRLLWVLEESQATMAGEDFGPPGPVHPQALLGDFAIPQRGIMAVGTGFFEPLDPARHVALPSRKR